MTVAKIEHEAIFYDDGVDEEWNEWSAGEVRLTDPRSYFVIFGGGVYETAQLALCSDGEVVAWVHDAPRRARLEEDGSYTIFIELPGLPEKDDAG